VEEGVFLGPQRTYFFEDPPTQFDLEWQHLVW